MCSNYRAVTDIERLATFFGVDRNDLNVYAAPLPRRVAKPKPPKGQPDPKDAPLP